MNDGFNFRTMNDRFRFRVWDNKEDRYCSFLVLSEFGDLLDPLFKYTEEDLKALMWNFALD